MPRISQRIAGAAAATLLGAALLAAPGASAQQGTQAPAQAAPAPASPAQSPSSTTSKRRLRIDRVEARIKSLHAQLKITPDEEPLWSNVAQVMRENARAIDHLAQQRSAKRGSMGALDNLRSYEEIADAHADEMKKLVPVFQALYDKMPDAQKKIADAVFSQRQRARSRTSG